MKRYKLKRDLPTFKAGDEFYLDSNNDLRLKGSDLMAYNHKTLEKFPNILRDWFEEIPEKYERWRGEKDDGYYFLSDGGDVYSETDIHDEIDNYRYNAGIYGRTKQELEAKLKYNVARQVLLDDAKGGKWKKDGTNLYVYYDRSVDKWISYKDIGSVQVVGVIYFQDENDIQKSLEEHKEQWEIVRKYEMGEL